MIRVAFNAVSLLSPFTGIAQYTHQLAKNLAETSEVDLNFFYGMAWSKNLREKPVYGLTAAKTMVKRIVPNIYIINRHLQQFKFNGGVKSHQADLYHEPNFLAFKSSKPSVITVHDLSWIRFPHMHPAQRVRAMEKFFEPGLHRASMIITDSEFVKRELIDMFNLQPHRIRSVPLGVEPLFHPRSYTALAPVLSQHGLTPGQYLLTVGTLEPRKNLQVVLRAYQQLPQHLRKQYPLVIVGMKGWHTSELEQQIAPLVRAGEIRQLGYLPREELAMVIAGALTMVYPSIYEGFGLPPLEAMTCGVPVITSNVSSLPEVVGDTGIQVNPHDVDAVTQTMEKLILDPDTRNALAQKARARSATFSWEKCAQQTIEVYKEAMKSC